MKSYICFSHSGSIPGPERLARLARRSAWIPALLALAIGAPRSTTAQVAGPPPFRVHSATGGVQSSPSVVTRGDGSFIVIWGGNTGVRGLRVAADGRPIGDEIAVRENLNTWWSSASSSARGDLVVVWNEEGVYPNAKLLVRRVGADGRAKGEGPVVVTDLDYGGHDVAMTSSGEFHVVWSDWGGGILLRSFDTAGTPIQDTPSGGDLSGAQPSVAVGDDGNPVVVWQTWGGQRGNEIRGQRFTSTGEKLGGIFDVPSDPSLSAWSPHVSMSPDGAFVVVWMQSPDGVNGARESTEVAGQRFNHDGAPVGPAFVVHGEDLGGQFEPTVSVAASGAFFVVWASWDEPGTTSTLYGQQFDPAGARIGPTLEIAGGLGADPQPAVAFSDTGARLVAWQTPSPWDVYARMLVGSIVEDGDGDGVNDVSDNCPTVANEDQADAQADGYGDACVSPDVVLPADLRLGLNPIIGAGATLAAKVTIGARARIGEWVSIGARVRAGDDLRVDDHAVIGGNTVVGDRVAIASAARIEGGVTIEDDVTLGERAVLRRRAKVGAGAVIEPWVVVFAGATVGPGARVETGARIGRGATVSPGAVVPAGTTVPPFTTFP